MSPVRPAKASPATQPAAAVADDRGMDPSTPARLVALVIANLAVGGLALLAGPAVYPMALSCAIGAAAVLTGHRVLRGIALAISVVALLVAIGGAVVVFAVGGRALSTAALIPLGVAIGFHGFQATTLREPGLRAYLDDHRARRQRVARSAGATRG